MRCTPAICSHYELTTRSSIWNSFLVFLLDDCVTLRIASFFKRSGLEKPFYPATTRVSSKLLSPDLMRTSTFKAFIQLHELSNDREGLVPTPISTRYLPRPSWPTKSVTRLWICLHFLRRCARALSV